LSREPYHVLCVHTQRTRKGIDETDLLACHRAQRRVSLIDFEGHVEGERVRLAQQLCWESTYARRRRSLNLPVLGA
jgi:hypothetical protein